LDTVIDFQTLFDDSRKLVNLIDSLPITFLLLLDYFEGTVLLTEYSVAALSLHSIHLEEVVGPSSTLDMERNHALAMLALDAGALILHSTNDTLQVEAFAVDLIQTNWSLGSHDRSRYPHSTAQVNPLIQSFS
jgi:hypothetical protein